VFKNICIVEVGTSEAAKIHRESLSTHIRNSDTTMRLGECGVGPIGSEVGSRDLGRLKYVYIMDSGHGPDQLSIDETRA
jgi:hypothetical protein